MTASIFLDQGYLQPPSNYTSLNQTERHHGINHTHPRDLPDVR
jgi:hypothetical protein